MRWEHPIKGGKVLPQNITIGTQNGDSTESKIIAGTDGVHSQVRKSSASGIQPKVLPYVVFHGTRRMALDDYQKLLAPQMKGCTTVQSHHEDAVFEIAVNDYYEIELHVGYTYSRLAR